MDKKLKVLHIDTEKYWGGGQNQVFLLHKYLYKKGIPSVVMAPKNAPLFQRVKEDFGYKSAIPLNIMLLFWNIVKNNFDVIHCHSGRALYFGILAKKLNPRIKLVYTRRVMGVSRRILSHIKYVDAFICVSKALKKETKSALPSNYYKKIFTIYDGVAPAIKSEHIPEWYLSKRNEEKIIGNIGSLNETKDQETLIRAFAKLEKKLYAKLIIIGDGPKKYFLKNLAEKLNISTKIIFTGFIPFAENYIGYFDLFVISSYKESLCSSIINAFFQKVPVVATTVGGIPELVINGETGYLAPPRNPKILSQKMYEALTNTQKNNEIVEKAYYRAQDFTFEKMGERNLELYKNLFQREK